MTEFLIAHIGHTQRHNQHIVWWKPDSKGYSICIDKAGRYSTEEAISICRTGECIAVPFAAAESLARSTPYYRRSNGTLAKLYDGDRHRPVDNEAQAWRHLLNTRLLCATATTKPTPVPASKANAIYLNAQP